MNTKAVLRVWVTRDEESDGPLASALKSHSLCPVVEPVVVHRFLTDGSDDLAKLGPSDWLVLTSPYAADSVNESLARVPKVAVVGDVTKEHAERRGFRVELVGPARTAEGVFSALCDMVSAGIVCYPRSSLATPPKPWADVVVNSPIIYETNPKSFDRTIIQRVDMVAVTSPSAVESIGHVDLPFASIGPTTSTALGSMGIEPIVEAPRRSLESLAETIAQLSHSWHHRA